jgi:hypothetical protein
MLGQWLEGLVLQVRADIKAALTTIIGSDGQFPSGLRFNLDNSHDFPCIIRPLPRSAAGILSTGSV